MKHLYTFTALLFVFIISIIIFEKDIPSISVTTTTATSIQDSTFPIVYLEAEGYRINTLHGYSSKLDCGDVRESITPLNREKTFSVQIDENESVIKRLSYELWDISNNKIMEENTITALEKTDSYKVAKIELKEAMDTSTEYGMQITLTTNSSKKIHFYTRLKYYENDFFLEKKMDFVTDFHKACFDKGKTLDITKYLEANTNDDATYADVNIHSNYKLITWGELNPEILTPIVPTIKEINIETAAIQQVYFVSAETADGRETFQVKEFYRVRYSGNRIYLLYFRRTMEAMFNPDLISVNKSEFKIGISGVNDLEINSSDSNNKAAFVRNGALWYYDLKTNKLYNVFTFEKDSKDYLRDCYDQHDIKILKVDDHGNMSFLVYGYMNCGDYEGRVGMLLYDYNAEDNRIKERVYIPITKTYQQLKEDLGDFCYVNDKNIFYFSLNDRVYAYNIASKRYDVLTDNASDDNFLMLQNAHCFVWSDASATGKASNITILDLESTKALTVSSPNDQSIVVLGTIDSNIVYGFVQNSDIHDSTTGEEVLPVYKLVISDCQGNVVREYRNKNKYVTSATVDDNVIRLKRIKKNGGKWVKTSDDSIMNQKNTTVESIKLSTRVTDKSLTEKYISLPAGYLMSTKPDLLSTKSVMITENPTLHLSEENSEIDSQTRKYYIYAYGGITKSTTNVAEAINLADEQMGVVMDNASHIVWERGGKFLSKQIANISYPSDTANTIKASTQMLLQAAQVTTTVSELKGNSIMRMLRNHLSTPVNLTGCTVDEILYFVSSERPVIAMLNDNHAVLITGYTSTDVTWMDPATHSSTTVALVRAEQIFQDSGYVFISFVA